jgi:glycosyltransferase involved in cell wall biosynthesis
MKEPKVAIVYDRANKWGGAERVLLALRELYPKATLFTSVYDEKGAPWAREFTTIKTSFLQKISYARKNHEYFALFMPIAFETFDFSKFDLVISVTSEAAKGIITGPNTMHICYCLTPTRYLWSGRKTYFDHQFKEFLSRPAVSYLRKWDFIASKRADQMIGISTAVQRRINKYYDRKVNIIFPPTYLTKFGKQKYVKKNYYLLVSRLVKYKRVDVAIRAFNKVNLKLIIVGTGREESALKRLAKKNIRFLSAVTDEELAKLYGEAKALIFPQHEDFGLVAVEAIASGTPVIAYRKGGAMDTIVDGVTGVFFNKQTPDSLITAVKGFDGTQFNKNILKKSAQNFSKARFLTEFATILKQ